MVYSADTNSDPSILNSLAKGKFMANILKEVEERLYAHGKSITDESMMYDDDTNGLLSADKLTVGVGRVKALKEGSPLTTKHALILHEAGVAPIHTAMECVHLPRWASLTKATRPPALLHVA